MKALLPVLLIVAALAGGLFGGRALKPVDEQAESEKMPVDTPMPAPVLSVESGFEYVKFSRQFVIPVIEDETTTSLIVADFQLEVIPGASEYAFDRRPKLRDVFLDVLYRHSHTGALKNSLVSDRVTTDLRADLLTASRKVLGDRVHSVLITGLLRQKQ